MLAYAGQGARVVRRDACDVAILAVEPAHPRQQRRGRSPQLGGSPLLRGLERVGAGRIAGFVHPAQGDHLRPWNMALQRCGDAARMQCEGMHTPLATQRIQLDGEQGVGSLRLRISQPLVVAPFELHVVPADRRVVVPGGGHGDHSRVIRERRPQEVHQGVVAKVIGRELRFPARAYAGLGTGHHTGVVDDDIGTTARGGEGLGEPTHAGQLGQVERLHLDFVEPEQRLPCHIRSARRNNDPRARVGQRLRGFQAKTGVAAGHDGGLSGEVSPRHHLAGLRFRSESRIDGGLPDSHENSPRMRKRPGA